MNTGLPLMAGKDYTAASVFEPANLLREARRQKDLPEVPIPNVCLLDPDGDIAAHLAATGQGYRHEGWACYHTQMWVGDLQGTPVGVVSLAVGAPFAVLVAEQLFASGAGLLISITSAGQLQPLANPPYFVLIDRALRDEGTSLHYQPPASWSRLAVDLSTRLTPALQGLAEPVFAGASWTTDAPYRETQTAIDDATNAGAVCVEMESAALYSFAAARHRDVVCLAHITNTMAQSGDDFEKGEANGVHAALAVVAATARALQVRDSPR